MKSIILISAGIVLVFILTGLPLSMYIFFQKRIKNNLDFSFLVASSLIVGFGTSALSVSFAYSFFGIDKYFLIYFILALLMWILFFVKRKNICNPFKKIAPISILLLPFTFTVYFCRSQWDSQLKPIITSGGGGDVAQNLLAAQIADKLGDTWTQTSHNLINELSVTNLNEAYLHLFDLPSYRDLAGFEYMIFGLRWGVTVPMNQLIKNFGPEIIMLEVGTVLMTVLFSLSIIFFACSKLLFKTSFLAATVTVILISNSAMLFQYFNGGISQAFGGIGIAGILLSLILFIKSYEENIVYIGKQGIFLISTFSWIGLIVCYISSALVLIPVIMGFCFITLILNRKVFNLILQVIAAPILTAFLLNPFLTYILISTSNNQNANLQTGYKTGIWQAPTQLLGLLNIYPRADNSVPGYTSSIILFSFILTIISGFFLTNFLIRSRKNPDLYGWLSATILVINLLALFVSFNGPVKSDYIYNKVNVYLSPLLMFSILVLLSRHEPFKRFNTLIISGIFVLVVIPSINFTQIFSSPTESIQYPYQYRNILSDKSIQEYLKSKNFIQPYKLAYNLSGVFGAEYSVARAPNNINLKSRIDNELVLFCFTSDIDCRPDTDKISNPDLEAYGISEYKSKLSTLEFYKLSVKEKYKYNFDSFGWENRVINDKFLGGNPYLN